MKSNNYDDRLLEHSNHPSHRGKMKNPDYIKTAVNHSCGDEITLMLKFDHNNQITDASWTGEGCAISKASADILCGRLLHEDNDSHIIDEVAEKMPGRTRCIDTVFRTLSDIPPSVLNSL